MEPIHQPVQSFGAKATLRAMTIDQIRKGPGLLVKTYSKLLSRLAQLAYANPDFVLLLRGQSRDFLEQGKTTLFPSMYRTPQKGPSFYAHELEDRYSELRSVEADLYNIFQNSYRERIGRSELARWAILQHYEVCATPLLDVTHSAHIAASFAFLNQAGPRGDQYLLFVLAVPQISGAVTVSPSQAIQIVRLSSVCPPETLRPYVQEGYLIGTYPSVDTIDAKMRYDRDEMDCARRLIAKFRIPTTSDFWDNGFQPLPKTAIYPDETNPLIQRIKRLKQD